MRVLITQTQPTAKRLAQMVEVAGHQPLMHPLLQVQQRNDRPPTTQPDVLVVLSQHAVHAVTTWSITAERVLAIGPNTADLLQQAGIDQVAIPSVWSSEGLLAHPWLAPLALQGACVLILSGTHGLNKVGDALSAQGIWVCMHPVYDVERVDQAALQALSEDVAHHGGLDVICVASLTALRHLQPLLDTWPQAWLEQVIWHVPSSRIAESIVLQYDQRVEIVTRIDEWWQPSS